MIIDKAIRPPDALYAIALGVVTPSFQEARTSQSKSQFCEASHG